SNSMKTSHYPHADYDTAHVGYDHNNLTQNSTQRVHDNARREIARRDFVQHRCKENEILSRDQRYFDIWPPRHMLVQIFCRVEPGEDAARDHDFSLFHTERLARRCAIVKDSLSSLSIGNRHAEVPPRLSSR